MRKRLIRFYRPARSPWNVPRAFGPIKRMRFDHHPPPKREHVAFGVWYAAGSLRDAVAETFGNLPGILDRFSGTNVCIVELSEPVDLVSLYGNGPRLLHRGLDHRIGTTTQYALTQKWARAIYEAFPDLMGIRWKGRQLGGETVVLTDRANFGALVLVEDYDISDSTVWPRIAAAAHYCSVKVVR